MSRTMLGFGLLILGSAACATPVQPEQDPARGAVAEGAQSSAAADSGERTADNATADTANPQPVAVEASAKQGAKWGPSSSMQEVFRAIWAEEDFQRRLAESYLRGSEVEPALTQREAQSRLEVLSLINEQRLKDAMARLQTLQGDNAVFDYMLGNIYFGQSKFDKAAIEYSKAVGRMSNFRRAWQNLAMAQMRNDNYDAARDAFVRVLSLGGASAQTYGLLGIMHAQLGDYVAAESAFRTVTMLEPAKESWRMMLAQTLYQQGRYAECASLCAVMLDKSPNNVDLWSMQGNAYAGMRDTKKAAENFEIVEELGGSTYDGSMLLGTIYFNDEVFGLAVDAYIRAMEKGKDRSHAPMVDIANRLAARSAYAESRRLIKSIETIYATKLDLEARTELRKMQARLAATTGATDEQVALLKQIVADNPLDGDALIQLGRHFQEKGDAATAILRFEQAARNEKFAAEAKVLHAQLLVSQDKFTEAAPLLRQAQTIKRRDDVAKLLEYVERAAGRGK